MRVYLCDDNPSHRVLYREVLREAPGLELVGASSHPRKAVADVARLQPDAILLDVAMPGADGFSAIRALRDASDAAIVMFSTAWSQENERRALSLGATAYVQKPRDIADLAALVKGATGDGTALVEHLVRRWLDGHVERACAALHHDVELVSLSSGTLQGVEAIRRKSLPHGVTGAVVRPIKLLERGATVVLLAEARVTRMGPRGPFVEHMAPGWVMTVAHGKIQRITAHASWRAAMGA